jgi:hypothetical protein
MTDETAAMSRHVVFGTGQIGRLVVDPFNAACSPGQRSPAHR